MRAHADYIYRNRDDSLRVRLFQRETGRWDYDVFYPSGTIKTYSEGAGDNFATKREALAEAIYQHGKLTPIAITGAVTDAAWYAKLPKHQKTPPMPKSKAQLDAEIAATLAKYAAPAEDNDKGVFYLTENSPTNPALEDQPEFRTFLAAKRAAMKLVREGKHPGVEVWHRWRGGNYMQGLVDEDGWSDV